MGKLMLLWLMQLQKNLSIEKSVDNTLDSDQILYHLLCKSHTVEALDWSNLEVLKQIENSVSQKESLERINPPLKSFFRRIKTTAEASIEALLNFVTHDKSGRPCSLANHFDSICVIKIIFLYRQHRLQSLQKLLDETESTNQLVEACRI